MADETYARIVAASRRPEFYRDFAVADNVDGRFDMICVHAFLVMRRLKSIRSAESTALSQAVFDLMFADMDASLRQMGVSDMRIGKEVKGMAKAFLGRVDAYDRALEGGDGGLASALVRNVYRGDASSVLAAARLAGYMKAAAAALAALADAECLAGAWKFPPPEAAEVREECEIQG